jgi:hypothetical protein
MCMFNPKTNAMERIVLFKFLLMRMLISYTKQLSILTLKVSKNVSPFNVKHLSLHVSLPLCCLYLKRESNLNK